MEKTQLLGGMKKIAESVALTLVKSAKVKEVADENKNECACLEVPDCESICGANGGTAKGDGTQACVCNPAPRAVIDDACKTADYKDVKDVPEFSLVARTAWYSDLLHIAPRALSATDGGNASDTVKFDGKTLRLMNNPAATRILSVNGSTINYIDKARLAEAELERIGAANFSSTSGKFTAKLSRDEFGRVSGIDVVNADCDCNCNCDCCNCGDDQSY